MKPGLRFAVLTRDNYTCRYCGAKAPDVKLHVDHAQPKAKGGRDTLDNLVTACQACNLGKHASLTEQAGPELSLDELAPIVDDILETARSFFLHDMAGLSDEWLDITGQPPSPKVQAMLAKMLLSCGFSEIRRAMYVSARKQGYIPNRLCECTPEEDCGIHASLDPFEIRMMLRRWHEEWLA